MANVKQENKGKRSYGPLIWGLIYLVNLGAYLLYLIFFVHTIPAPATPASLAEQPYFDGCTILDSTVSEYDDGHRNYMADFVLFENPAGEVKITELRYNYFLARYRIKESSTITVTDPVQFTAEFPFFVGHNTVTVNDLASFDTGAQYEGFPIQQNHVESTFVAIGIAITLVESLIVLLIEKIRKGNE